MCIFVINGSQESDKDRLNAKWKEQIRGRFKYRIIVKTTPYNEFFSCFLLSLPQLHSIMNIKSDSMKRQLLLLLELARSHRHPLLPTPRQKPLVFLPMGHSFSTIEEHGRLVIGNRHRATKNKKRYKNLSPCQIYTLLFPHLDFFVYLCSFKT